MEKRQILILIKEYLIKKNIKKASLFGSFARDEEKENSDIDLLIDAQGLSMFDILRIEDELSTLISRKIDLVEFKAIKESIKKYILPDIVELI